MRTFLFWFAILGPRGRVLFLLACGLMFYCVSK
jgi:hypothetical protein